MIPLTAEEKYAQAEEILARELAARVVERLMARQKEAVVVFTGSNIGTDAALASLATLKKHGFTFRVLLSNAASRILDVEAIKSALEPKALWVGAAEESPEALTRRYDTFIVPALTVNTAAHVAGCMADSPAAAVILDGLMRGKNVVIARDGCCPDNPERAKRGFRMTEPLKEALRRDLEVLRSYGAVLTGVGRLGEKTLKTIGLTGVPATDPPAACAIPARGSGAGVFTGRVLSGRHLGTVPDGAVFPVSGRTLVTELARDEARRRAIAIRIVK